MARWPDNYVAGKRNNDLMSLVTAARVLSHLSQFLILMKKYQNIHIPISLSLSANKYEHPIYMCFACHVILYMGVSRCKLDNLFMECMVILSNAKVCVCPSVFTNNKVVNCLFY